MLGHDILKQVLDSKKNTFMEAMKTDGLSVASEGTGQIKITASPDLVIHVERTDIPNLIGLLNNV